MRRIFSIIFIVLGLLSIGIAEYIDRSISQGLNQIDSAEGSLDQLGKISSLSPITKSIDIQINKKANSKIEQGYSEIQEYTLISNLLKIASVAFLGISGFLFFKKFSSKK